MLSQILETKVRITYTDFDGGFTGAGVTKVRITYTEFDGGFTGAGVQQIHPVTCVNDFFPTTLQQENVLV
jgi:hypothetical protein